MKDWWELGSWSGSHDRGNGAFGLTCGWCEAEDNFRILHSVSQKHSTSEKILTFQILQCAKCANHTVIMKSDGTRGSFRAPEKIIGYRRIPWSLSVTEAPKHWPEDIRRYWLQSHRTAETKSWDAAAMTIRSAMQLALRHKGAQGGRLVDEIKDLVKKGELPPLMGDWATEVRLLGNDGTHPAPGDAGTTSVDAQDALQYLDYLLEYLFTLPHRIDEYRKRKTP
jgi:hypothetical protein